MYVLSVQYSCVDVSVFLVVAGFSSQNENMFLKIIPIGLLHYDLLGDVCIS